MAYPGGYMLISEDEGETWAYLDRDEDPARFAWFSQYGTAIPQQTITLTGNLTFK